MKKILIGITMSFTSITSFANCLDLYGTYTLEVTNSLGSSSEQVYISLRSVEDDSGVKTYNVYDKISTNSQSVLFNYRVSKKDDKSCFLTFNDNWSDFWIFPKSVKSYNEITNGKLYQVHSFLKNDFGGINTDDDKSLYRFKKEISHPQF